MRICVTMSFISSPVRPQPCQVTFPATYIGACGIFRKHGFVVSGSVATRLSQMSPQVAMPLLDASHSLVYRELFEPGTGSHPSDSRLVCGRFSSKCVTTGIPLPGKAVIVVAKLAFYQVKDFHSDTLYRSGWTITVQDCSGTNSFTPLLAPAWPDASRHAAAFAQTGLTHNLC